MIEGNAKVCIGEKSFDLSPDDTLLVPSGTEFLFDPCKDAYALTALMNPANKSRANL
jgi:mannose-6-phosphate isomerase-like protein (cupin superfamily)